MPNVEKSMRMFGRLYEWGCKIPWVGVPTVKAWNRVLGSLIFRAPEPGGKPKESITGVKDYLLWSGKEMNFPFEIIEESVGPESFEFYVNGCPYGFKRPDQAAACDAAMEMDRKLFGLLGAELVILESAPEGVQKCRMMLKWRG
jgi:hypothetical protein